MINLVIKIVQKMGQYMALKENFYNLNSRQMGFVSKADCSLQKDVFFTNFQNTLIGDRERNNNIYRHEKNLSTQ